MARISKKRSTKNHPENTKISASTFAKRRNTIFRRASELSTLTGANIGIITFSSLSNNNKSKLSCFGSPDLHSVVDRYLNNGTSNRQELQRTTIAKDAIDKCNIVKREYEYQQQRAKVLERMIEERKGNKNYWWDAPIETLNLGQLEELKKRLQNIARQVDYVINEADNVVSNNPQ